MSCELDLVILVPGFFGFSRIGGFYYFADRVGSALRGALELRLGRSVPVVPVTTEPAGSLLERQQTLLAEIDRRLTLVKAAFAAEQVRVHLVCHSTGGVDAVLLTRRFQADGKPWPKDGPVARVRAALRSVVCIAAPLWGSALTLTGAARFYDGLQMQELPAAARVIWSAMWMYIGEQSFGTVDGFMVAVAQQPEQGARYISHLLRDRRLVEDLHPTAMAACWAQNPPDLPVLHRSFVTVGVHPYRLSDPLYTCLHEQIAQQAARIPEDDRTHQTLQRLRACDNIIRSQDAPQPGGLSDFSVRDNDGVVDSSRQLLDPGGAELAGVVLGDHADVLGRYDRIDRLAVDRDEAPLRTGVFHSGAQFSDESFFMLYRQVAEIITTAAR